MYEVQDIDIVAAMNLLIVKPGIPLSQRYESTSPSVWLNRACQQTYVGANRTAVQSIFH